MIIMKLINWFIYKSNSCIYDFFFFILKCNLINIIKNILIHEDNNNIKNYIYLCNKIEINNNNKEYGIFFKII